MEPDWGPHPNEDELEQYSMGTLPEQRVSHFEDHLLLCESCQLKMAPVDEWVGGNRRVGPRLRAEGTGHTRPFDRLTDLFRWIRPQWVTVAAVGILAVAIGLRFPNRADGPVNVFLEVSRGSADALSILAPAGRPLALAFDVTELSPFPRYRLTVVDEHGATLCDLTAPPAGQLVSVDTGKRLAAGRYFARVYSPAGELLREFALAIQ